MTRKKIENSDDQDDEKLKELIEWMNRPIHLTDEQKKILEELGNKATVEMNDLMKVMYDRIREDKKAEIRKARKKGLVFDDIISLVKKEYPDKQIIENNGAFYLDEISDETKIKIPEHYSCPVCGIVKGSLKKPVEHPEELSDKQDELKEEVDAVLGIAEVLFDLKIEYLHCEICGENFCKDEVYKN